MPGAAGTETTYDRFGKAWMVQTERCGPTTLILEKPTSVVDGRVEQPRPRHQPRTVPLAIDLLSRQSPLADEVCQVVGPIPRALGEFRH